MADRWRERAGCAGLDVELFFTAELEAEAVAACGRCDVRPECLEEALVYRLPGVWGGLTERQRRRLLDAARRVASDDR